MKLIRLDELRGIPPEYTNAQGKTFRRQVIGLLVVLEPRAGGWDRRRTIDAFAKQIMEGQSWPLEIIMPCRNWYSFESVDKIPVESVPCDCGSPSHFVVHWSHGSPELETRVAGAYLHPLPF